MKKQSWERLTLSDKPFNGDNLSDSRLLSVTRKRVREIGKKMKMNMKLINAYCEDLAGGWEPAEYRTLSDKDLFEDIQLYNSEAEGAGISFT